MENQIKKESKENYLEIVKKLVENIKYGTVTIIVQDGKVIQIDKSEKYRIR